MQIRVIVILALSLLLVGCGSSDVTGQQAISEENLVTPTVNPSVTSTNTPIPTSTSTPTNTPIPTSTSTPTNTPIPTTTSTPTDTPIPTFTSTPTDTPFPTNTPVPSLTPLPDLLAELPQYGPNDVVVVAGAFVFQIISVDVFDTIGDNITPNDGNRFLLFDGLLYNYSDTLQDFSRTNFAITSPDGRTILPSLNRMQQLQQNNPDYTNIEYPRREFVPLNNLTVDARQWREIFIVYEVPESFDETTLTFNPANIEPPSTIGLWVVQEDNSEDHRIYKAYDNGVALFEIDFEFTNRRVQLEELIDEELIEVDNCFGNASIRRTFTFSEEIATSYNIGGDIAATGADVVGTAAGALLGNPIVGQILTSGFTGFFNLEESEMITVTREEQLSAAPGTKTRYQLSWYRVTLQGTLQLQVGGENFYIPYTITDRLRSDLESLTPGECEISD